MDQNKHAETVVAWYQQQLANTQLELANKTAECLGLRAQLEKDPNA